ncbi:hydroxymyristoyl-ACP dehydratase [Bacteroides sp. 51]|uniref:hydroxymyristoyl-ACP dehydratase n=1 Tax=Bacteroides sp. 51 TaxID=2302938 RepID=UPI0013D13015|nr:hydroxymyristoyl-ACP dehydratase [Bacteroides sp. 51]NDV81071.1 hydroxymyristoyl-ACP dehydratase [Bacteroides sp. 51]
MLIAQFYTPLSQETTGETAWTVSVELNPHHAVYQGHFPGNPVLPGVCTLQIIKECLEELMDSTLQYAQVNSCKYLSAINPYDTPRLQLNLAVKELEDHQIQLLADGRTGDTDFIKLKATLARK